MNRTIAAITLTGLLAACPLFASAAAKTADESAAPPTALPGVNQASKAQSNTDKADKKGEEASGSNSGAESHETAKDAATSSDSENLGKSPKP